MIKLFSKLIFLLTLSCVLLLVSGCFTPPDPSGQELECDENVLCNDGFVCVNGFCEVDNSNSGNGQTCVNFNCSASEYCKNVNGNPECVSENQNSPIKECAEQICLRSDKSDFVQFVIIESSLPGADIYYTLDESVPGENSELYYTPVSIRNPTTVKAIAIIPGKTTSNVGQLQVNLEKTKNVFDFQSKIYIEGEATNDFEGFYERPDLRASNNVYMLGLDDEYGQGYLNFNVKPASTATYTIWIRATGSVNWATMFTSVNGGEKKKTYHQPTQKINGWNFHWQKIGSYQLTGEQVSTIKVGRGQGGPKVDKIYITSGSDQPPEISIISPAGGEIWDALDDNEIRWESSGDLQNVRIEFSRNNGETWEQVVSSTQNDGEYVWQNFIGEELDNCKIRISASDESGMFDVSMGSFSISEDLNKYSSEKKMRTRQALFYGKTCGDRGTEENYYDFLKQQGTLKLPLALNARVNDCAENERNEFGFRELAPDAKGVEAFRSTNGDYSNLIIYTCLHGVDAGPTKKEQFDGGDIGEGLTGRTVDYPDWFLRDENDDIIYNGADLNIGQTRATHGRKAFDFAHPEVQNHFVERAILYADAGIYTYYYDNFRVLEKRNYNYRWWNRWIFDENDKIVDSEPLEVMNPRTGQPYTTMEYIHDYQFALANINKMIDRHYGSKNKVLQYANGLYYDTLIEDAYYNKQIVGFYREGYYGGNVDLESVDGYRTDSGSLVEETMVMFLADNLDIQTIMGTAIVTGGSWSQTEVEAANFQLAAFLLGIKNPDTLSTMRSYRINWEKWPGLDTVELGRFVPKERAVLIDQSIFKREFTDALVYVNFGKVSKSVNLDGDYYYLQDNGYWSSNTISSKILNPGRGLILVKQKIFN